MMKKITLSLLLLFYTVVSMNAQSILKGDMDDNGELTIGDVTTLVDILAGKLEPLYLSVSQFSEEPDNDALIGAWQTEDTKNILIFEKADDAYIATYNDLNYTYQYYPDLEKLILYDIENNSIKVMLFVKKSEDSQSIQLFDNGVGQYVSYLITELVKVESVTLSPSSLELNVGETGTLEATVAPETARQVVRWSNADKTVATVEEGVVTAVAPGSTTITCTATDGSGISATCDVVVIQKAESITLSATSQTIKVGDDPIQLEATVLPETTSNKDVTWTSSDESIATVDETGIVTAVSAGTATITCTAADESGVSATCEITVIQLVTEITLSSSSLNLEVGNTKTLLATVLPENANDKSVTWTSSDESVVTVDEDGTVTAIAIGTTTITCTAVDGSEVFANCEVTVQVGYEYVDLGLDSGTLWATCNVGATDPADPGDLFAWGEIETKETFSWSNYKYCEGTKNTLTKYCFSTDYWAGEGDPDKIGILESTDDAAIQLWGDDWCMPSSTDLAELLGLRKVYKTYQYNEKTIVGIEVYNKLYGYPSMFLPICVLDDNNTTTPSAYYWANNTNAQYGSSDLNANHLLLGVDTETKTVKYAQTGVSQNRYKGFFIRPVRKK